MDGTLRFGSLTLVSTSRYVPPDPSECNFQHKQNFTKTVDFLSLQLERCASIIGTPREVVHTGPARQQLSVTAYCAYA